jgi:hypothetical protein
MMRRKIDGEGMVVWWLKGMDVSPRPEWLYHRVG